MDCGKLKGLLGLSVRAGQAVFGEDGCMKALRNGQGGLLVLDESLSERVREKYLDLCRREGIPVARLPEGLLFEATGRPGKAAVLRKGNLAEQAAACTESGTAD